MNSKLALRVLLDSKWPKSVPGPPLVKGRVAIWDQKCPKTGVILRQKTDKNHVDFESRRIGHLEGRRVAKWTLQTSKIDQHHWRSCEFQLFTLFSPKSLWLTFELHGGSFWELFVSHFGTTKYKKSDPKHGRHKDTQKNAFPSLGGDSVGHLALGGG